MEVFKNNRLATAALVVGGIIGTYFLISRLRAAQHASETTNQQALRAEAKRLEMVQEPYYLDLD
jgi:uncharacterized membrane-anchored protein YhcB (DUF1043 family)